MVRKRKEAPGSQIDPIKYDPRTDEHSKRIEKLDDRVRHLEIRVHGFFVAGGILLSLVSAIGLYWKFYR